MSVNEAPEEPSQGRDRSLTCHNVCCTSQTKLLEIGVHFNFRSNPRVKGLPNTGLLEQAAGLFAKLNPFLFVLTVAPLVKHGTAGCEHAVGLSKDFPPILCEIQQAGDDDRVESACLKRQQASFADHDGNSAAGSFGS